MRAACLDMIHQLARADARVVYIGSDLGAGTLDAMKQELPDRFFMEGVSEANLVGLAAGLAMDGYIPYVHTIANFFTRRAYEQIAVDLCLHALPVRLVGNGGGLVYAPLGPTHMATEDIAGMRALPTMTVVACADAAEMRRFMPTTLDLPGPVYIRLAKGHDTVVTGDITGFEIGRAVPLRPAGPVLFVTTGVMAQRALAAADRLAPYGIAAGVLHMPTIKPLDTAGLLAACADARLVVSVEEHTLLGGFGSAIAETFVDHDWRRPPPTLLRLGLPDRFLSDYGSQDHLLEQCGLHPDGIAASVRQALDGAADIHPACRPAV